MHETYLFLYYYQVFIILADILYFIIYLRL